MRLYLLLIFFISSSCGSNGIVGRSAEPNIPSHDTFFDPYLKNIEELFKNVTGKEYEFNIPVVFGDLSEKYNGMCYTYENPKFNYIEINKRYFVKEDGSIIKDDLEQVLIHELGHCYFNRDHLYTLVRKKSTLSVKWGDFPSSGYTAKEDLYGVSVLLTPKSLMWPIYIDREIYSNNKIHFVKELIDENINFHDVGELHDFNNQNIPPYSSNIEYSVYRKSNQNLEFRTFNYYEFVDKLYNYNSAPLFFTEENYDYNDYNDYNDHFHRSCPK